MKYIFELILKGNDGNFQYDDVFLSLTFSKARDKDEAISMFEKILAALDIKDEILLVFNIEQNNEYIDSDECIVAFNGVKVEYHSC